jgi:hypothetical protein
LGLFPGKGRWPSRPNVRVLIGLLSIFTVAGCGPRSDRLAISGKVTLNGVPLDAGSIRFSSLPGGKMYATGAMVKDGEYKIPQPKGLPPGRYHVEINSPDLKAPPVASRAAPGEPLSPPTAPERIPPEYNTNSTQTVDVAASNDNQFEFDITSGRTK